MMSINVRHLFLCGLRAAKFRMAISRVGYVMGLIMVKPNTCTSLKMRQHTPNHCRSISWFMNEGSQQGVHEDVEGATATHGLVQALLVIGESWTRRSRQDAKNCDSQESIREVIRIKQGRRKMILDGWALLPLRQSASLFG